MEAKKTNWKPEGFHSLTPHLTVSDVEKAIEFYKDAFAAEEISRLAGPGGAGVMHAELKIGDSFFMLGQSCDESSHEEHHEKYHGEEHEGKHKEHEEHASCMVHIYVEDVDAAFERAKAAGAKVTMPPENMFWGDRYGMVSDPFGHSWSLATHIEDITPEQMSERAEEFFAKMSKK
ncbi:MAG: VOC family protein [Candidatus Abyssobacteria bacterium SURF_5]|uniref:VOC family protein n=1 Tax=Abyssobacteria bacterium (strain SURF_5) TaxID=2093360 RepID=A0A3A4NSY0_ABYX5|nr:MAG: VOC family protein [Candidatus Abyssubacteria bacterium SURF_5]